MTKEVYVIVEGQTEEQFVKKVLAPYLNHQQIYLKPIVLQTSRIQRGGGVNKDRFLRHVSNTLKMQRSIVTSMIDLYGLSKNFPGCDQLKPEMSGNQKADIIEACLHQAVVEYTNCRSDRFIPYVQPYEYEALLFSDIDQLVQVEPGWSHAKYVTALQAIVNQFETPEQINGQRDTLPSNRLHQILTPTYRKVRHGPLIAQRITIPVLAEKCHHFAAWIQKLSTL